MIFFFNVTNLLFYQENQKACTVCLYPERYSIVIQATFLVHLLLAQKVENDAFHSEMTQICVDLANKSDKCAQHIYIHMLEC